MSRSGRIDLLWGDGEHTYRLAIKQLEELEEKTKSTPLEVFDRLNGRRWHVSDVYQVLRLGLIGGGMPVAEAAAFVTRHLDEWSLIESAGIALSVMVAALVGDPGDPVGKEEAGEAPSASASPASTETAPRSASRRSKSAK